MLQNTMESTTANPDVLANVCPSDQDLCSECKSFAPMGAAFWHSIANGNEKFGFPHYDSVWEMKQSASTGCPWCSLMWSALLENCKEEALPEDHSITLFFWRDRSTDFFTGDQRDEFRIDVHCGDHASKFVGHLVCFAGMTNNSQLFTDQSKASAQDTNTGSDASLNRIRAWMSMCNENHSRCNDLRPKHTPLPTRVLDVGGPDSESCKLITSNGKDGVFAALSHSWGSIHPLTTTQSTFSQRQEAIPDTAMPKSFLDAVNVCRKLDIPYLWIDSLCIIQDSRSDWAAEAPTMGAVYNNATLTIAATAAADSTGGCYQPRNALALTPCLLTLFSTATLVSRHPTPWAEIYGDVRAMQDRALDRRAWILQEQVLSHRTLGFGATEVTWSCASLSASETHPLGLLGIPQLTMDYKGSLHRVLCSPAASVTATIASEESTKHRIYGFWYRTVMDFTARNLTFTSDKLAALSGLASRFAASTGDAYLAGLWGSDLCTGLLWKSGADIADSVQTTRDRSGRAPTWSWASVDGFVDYVRVVPSLDQPEEMQTAAVATILDVEGAQDGDAVFGATCMARLKFEATLFSVMYRDGVLSRSSSSSTLESNIDSATAEVQELGKFWADESNATQGQWMCMPLCVVVKSAGYAEGEVVADKVAGDGIWCLVLAEVDGEMGLFERVGICRVVDQERGAEVMELLEAVGEIVTVR